MVNNMIPLGDQALLINFQQKIDYRIHDQVMSLYLQLKSNAISGVKYMTPGYSSLTVGYDPGLISYLELKSIIRQLTKLPKTPEAITGRKLTLPVCYQAPYAADLAEVTLQKDLSKGEIIELHTANPFRVFMLGFLPGFPYMGILPESLVMPRKSRPSIKIPERSVGIAGEQTGIYPWESPGGWHIIGRTPLPVYHQTHRDPFLFRVGDQVQFRSITASEYRHMRNAVSKNDFKWSSIVTDES